MTKFEYLIIDDIDATKAKGVLDHAVKKGWEPISIGYAQTHYQSPEQILTSRKSKSTKIMVILFRRRKRKE